MPRQPARPIDDAPRRLVVDEPIRHPLPAPRPPVLSLPPHRSQEAQKRSCGKRAGSSRRPTPAADETGVCAVGPKLGSGKSADSGADLSDPGDDFAQL